MRGWRSLIAFQPAKPVQPASSLVWGLIALLGLALAGCTLSPPQATDSGPESAPEAAPDGRPLVLTTFTVLADMARQVAGDHLQVESITKVGAEIHGYEPTPADLKRVGQAQLILDNGLNLEAWAARFYSGAPAVPRATLSEGILPLPIATDAAAGQPNPHAWLSPKLAEIYVENIRRAFTTLDPAHAEAFRRNADRYRLQLRALDRELTVAVAGIPVSKRVLVSCEGAFSYLAADYGLKEAYLWPVNAESQVTPQRMARLIELVRKRNVPAVFCESTVSDESQRQVAAESGARFGGTLYVDSLSAASGPASSLLALQRHNIRTLVGGLQRP
ncbi:metal ABC transporter substrate-binding protein [Synechococcus sp. CS-1325]|nr:metal ABC transporter substrate-binding protein [Synechococcus sp. CS-1325]PZV00114.1 MAG: metal ABC transporter substrate-binding protein [Cyanobium sp.]